MTAVVDGAADRLSHSARNSTPLTMNDAGTRTAGAILAPQRAWAATSSREHAEVAMSIIGSVVTASEVRNSASRVALPPTNCAVTEAAQSIAIIIERDLVVITFRLPFVGLPAVPASLTLITRQMPTLPATWGL